MRRKVIGYADPEELYEMRAAFDDGVLDHVVNVLTGIRTDLNTGERFVLVDGDEEDE